LGLGVGHQFLGGTGFANAGLTHQHDQLPLAGQGILQNRLKLAHLPLAPDKLSTR
jgi:hypothetical protein